MARYSQKVVERASTRKSYVNGWYRVRCTQAKRQEPHEESGNHRGDLNFAPLRKDDTEAKPGMRFFITYPLENEDIPNHEAPETEWQTIPLVQALFPKECPLFPRTDKKTQKLMFKGKVADKANTKELTEEASIACLDKLVALEKDPEPYVGKECYLQVYYKEGNDYPQLGKFCTELPAGETLVPEDEWMGVVKSKTNGKGGRATPAKGGSKKKKKGGKFRR
jgi:hypothetical protein